MTMLDCKQCPFCGSQDIQLMPHIMGIGCMICAGSIFPRPTMYRNTAELVMAWNTRAPLDGLLDPIVVHANMMAGKIAKPTWAQIMHLYPAEVAALQNPNKE